MSLTGEDKVWLVGQLGGLGAKLEALEARFSAKLDSLDSRLDVKLETLEARFDVKLGTLEASLDAKLQALGARFDGKLEALGATLTHLETALLTAFHKWASPSGMRARSHSAALRTLDFVLKRSPSALLNWKRAEVALTRVR